MQTYTKKLIFPNTPDFRFSILPAIQSTWDRGHPVRVIPLFFLK